MGDELLVTAIMAAYNEADVVGQVVQDLVGQGIGVYLLDHGSTDATVAEVRRCAGDALLGVESLDVVGFSLEAIVRRKAELAAELPGSWFINQDADELREAPWSGCNLLEGIRRVDALGYNAIDFEVLNFWPTDDRFRPGDDLRESFRYFERGGAFDRLQIRAWKRGPAPVDLVSSAGHEAAFEGRNVFPLRFLLRHYPIRSQAHGARKVFAERRPRFDAAERQRGWHVQYRQLQPGHVFIRAPETLQAYDPIAVRLQLALRHRDVEHLEASLAAARAAGERLERDLQARGAEIETLNDALALRSLEKQQLGEALALRGQEVEKLNADLALRSAEKQRLAESLAESLEQRCRELEGSAAEHVRQQDPRQQRDRDRLSGEERLAAHALEGRRQAQAESERAALLGQLDGPARELAVLRTRLAALESSLTWRLTAPLRAASRRLRR